MANVETRGRRKVQIGEVVKNGGDKTIVVRISTRVPHPLYGKVVRRSTRFVAHDEENVAQVGDTVRIMETRPLSKTKRWRLTDVLERAQ